MLTFEDNLILINYATLDRHHCHIPLTEVRLLLKGEYFDYFIHGSDQAFSIIGIYPRIYIYPLLKTENFNDL